MLADTAIAAVAWGGSLVDCCLIATASADGASGCAGRARRVKMQG